MPSLSVTQKTGTVYFNAADGVDLCGYAGQVVALSQNASIPEFVGTPLSAIPSDGQLLAVVLQGQPNQGTCAGALIGVASYLVEAALSETPGTLSVGAAMTITANGTWKVAGSGEEVYGKVVHLPYRPGFVEITIA